MGLVLIFALFIPSAAAQSVTVIPTASGSGPVGVVLQGRYERFAGRSLLSATTAAETAPQRLARRYVQLLASKDRQELIELFFPGDGSRARMSGIGGLDALKPGFRLSSAELLEQLQWGAVTILRVTLQGTPALTPEPGFLWSFCPTAQSCYLFSPLLSPKYPEYRTLDSAFNLFSKHSSSATSAQTQAFLAKKPLTVAIEPKRDYISPEGVPVQVKVLVEPYALAVPARTSVERAASDQYPELAALFAFLKRVKALKVEQVTTENADFRRFMDEEFQADYAADLTYRVYRLVAGQYVGDSLDAADFVTAMRGWDSAEPACAVRHGDTVFVYVMAGPARAPKALQMFPLTVINGRAKFDALKFGNYIGDLMDSPELVTELHKSCRARRPLK
jgi:hypothetical protein